MFIHQFSAELMQHVLSYIFNLGMDGFDIITIEGKFGRKDVFEDELVFNLDTISKFIRNGKEKR